MRAPAVVLAVAVVLAAAAPAAATGRPDDLPRELLDELPDDLPSAPGRAELGASVTAYDLESGPRSLVEWWRAERLDAAVLSGATR